MKNKITRIIIDSQSNPFFLGIESEQNYDQRAALSQGRKGDIVITTNPIDPNYIRYWKKLGFNIPILLTAGPFEKSKILSELILNKKKIQKEIKLHVNGQTSRLEFFTPSEKEEKLAKHLQLPAYVNFDFAKEMQKKSEFKKLCKELNISTLPYISLNKNVTWKEVVDTLGRSENGYFAKHIYGIGGIGLGTIVPLKTEKDLMSLKESDNYIIEKTISVALEISVHWEICFDNTVKFINFFEQISENSSYAGTIFPARFPKTLRKQIFNEYLALSRKIAELKGLGFMCCDILVDENGKFYWSDFNPRKGAILFVNDAVNGFLKNYKLSKKTSFIVHKQVKSSVSCFSELENLLGQHLVPSLGYIVLITNPGVIQYGTIDVTVISFISHEHATVVFQEIESLIIVK